MAHARGAASSGPPRRRRPRSGSHRGSTGTGSKPKPPTAASTPWSRHPESKPPERQPTSNEGEGIMSNPVVIDATPGQSYADITREFEAPVAAVFRAHADPDLFKIWIGPRGLRDPASRTGTSAPAAATASSRRWRRRDLRVPRRLPHGPRERADHPDVRVRGLRRTRSASTSSASRSCRADGRASSITACSRRVEVLEGMIERGHGSAACARATRSSTSCSRTKS